MQQLLLGGVMVELHRETEQELVAEMMCCWRVWGAVVIELRD